MAVWKRDISTNYPRIYKEFISKGGKKYWIQDLTEEYFEETLELYANGFLKEEPIGKYAGCTTDPACVNEVILDLLEKLQQKISLVCLTRNDLGETCLVGYNCLYIMMKDKEKGECKSPITQRFLKLISYLFDKKDPYTEFGADKFIGAMGLYIKSEYRGEGLGEEILLARKFIGVEQGFVGSLTIFSSFISQKQAERAGFKDYVVSSFEELGNINEKFKFPGIEKHTELCKYMYILF